MSDRLSPERVSAAPRRLDTTHLHLRAPRVEHAAAFLDSLLVSLPTLQFVGWGRNGRDLDWAERFCREGARMVDDGECVVFNAFERDGGAYVGRIDLHSFDAEAPRCEIGYVGDVRRAGRGLMREAVLAVVGLGFDTLGLARIHALSDVRNTRALHFAETLGFVREGVLRHWERGVDDELIEQAMYAAYNPRLVP